MIALKRILVPIDFSEFSDASLKYGVALATSARRQLLSPVVLPQLRMLPVRDRRTWAF